MNINGKEIKIINNHIENVINSHSWMLKIYNNYNVIYNDYKCINCSYYLCQNEFNSSDYLYCNEKTVNIHYSPDKRNPNLTCAEIQLKSIIE